MSTWKIASGEAVLLITENGPHQQRYNWILRKSYANITHVLDTHLHADHISGGRAIAQQTGATYWLPPEDAARGYFFLSSA